MFCALGAAAFTHVATPVTLTWAAALIVAMAVAAAAGVAVASLTIRAGGLGLALATFAVAAVAERTMYRTRLLFGTTGIRAAARPAGVLGADRGYFYVAAVIALLAVSGSALLGRSDAGRMWRAAGDDPVALSALGGSVLTSRVLVFAIAAGLAGLGGALAAAGAQSVSANTFATFPALSWLAVLAIAGRRVGTTAARAAPAFALAPVYLSRFVGAHPLLWFGGAAVAASLIRARPIRSGAKA
jgi:ABC-type branched-subunit amino acid transport system permease subunit